MITILVEPERFAADEVEIVGEAYRHVFRASRTAVGETLRLVDGRGQARWARVLRVERARAVLAPGGPAPANEPARAARLLVPLPRPERAAWLVEKATELGVSAIRFIHCERAPRAAGEGTLARLRRVAAAAVEQSQRAVVPDISGVHDWREVAALLEGTTAFVASPGAPAAAWGGPAGVGPAGDGASVALVIGPEGGFTPEEAANLDQLGCIATGLGPTILRIETAALVGLGRLLV